jgi:HlyD family secretion protein
MHNKRKIVPVLLILILITIGGWYLFQRFKSQNESPMQASGRVETVELVISAEIAGRVLEVYSNKGDRVSAGDPLFSLDDELLISQRERAARALEAAQANQENAQKGLEMAQASLKVAEANYEAVLANTEAELAPVEQALAELYENADLIKAEAEQEVAAGNRALREAQYKLDQFTVPTEQQDLTALEAVVIMELKLEEAREAFEPYKYRSSSDPLREEYKEALDEAQSDYDSAIRRLEYVSAVDQARTQLNRAVRKLESVQDGPDPDDVALLDSRIAAIGTAPKQVESTVEQAIIGIAQAQTSLEASKRALRQVQAELDLIDVQIKKLTVYAPVSGVVLSRNVEPGEVIQAGAPAMILGDLDRLTITVYVPEDRYGLISLGMEARVTVDSFPGEVFSGTVIYIADRAEFTPRNVQTPEGRRTTVFAVELLVDDPEDKLKPGMPADVEFVE